MIYPTVESYHTRRKLGVGAERTPREIVTVETGVGAGPG